MLLYKEYFPHPKGESFGEIKMSIFFIGGQYRVNVLPVKRTKEEGYNMEESEAYSGFNDTLLRFERQSKNRLKLACEVLKTNQKKYLDYFKYDN